VSRTAARRWLWLVALATMPVPFYLGEVEWAPVMRLGFLSSLLSLVLVSEGGRSLSWIAGMGIFQTLLYTGLFYIASGLAARGVERIGEPPLRVAAVGTAVFLLVASSLLPIYETPLSSTRLHSDLWHLFE
jgi:hypothetical protein